jgi:cobalt-zinc-cadmium efflux system membrane fusion protein
MKIAAKIATALMIAVSVYGTVKFINDRSAAHEASLEEKKPAPHDPGVIRFAEGEAQLSSIRIEAVASEPMPEADPVNGRVVYDENATARVVSPLIGRVLSLRANPGDRVGKGVTLLEVDAPELASAEADLAKSQSEELRKRLAFERAKTLHEHEVIARKEFESADVDYRQAQADTRRASLRLRNLQSTGRDNGRFQLRSPIAGMIITRNVNPGQEVRPDLQDPLFLISDVSRLWVLVDIPEKQLSHVHVGQTLSLETDAWPEQRFSAVVDRVGLAVDPVTRRVQVRCSVKNADFKLKPEMFVRVSFPASGERQGIRLANKALISEGVKTFVFVERGKGVFQKTEVKIGLHGSDISFIESGLNAGDKVVVEGVMLLNAEASADAQ